MRGVAVNNKVAAIYSFAVLLSTFLVGQLILVLFPKGNSLGSSVLFILMNLIPMIAAYLYSRLLKESTGLLDFLKRVFVVRESRAAYIGAMLVPAIYYGVSSLLQNVAFTNAGLVALLAYFPWTLLQGGLEEVGWRWFLQRKLKVNSFTMKMLVVSVVWFLWHIPVYRLPWITAGSSNYVLFYLLILGNTFMLGALMNRSIGAIPCVLAHMLVDSLAMLMLVQANILKVSLLVFIEILIAVVANRYQTKTPLMHPKVT